MRLDLVRITLNSQIRTAGSRLDLHVLFPSLVKYKEDRDKIERIQNKIENSIQQIFNEEGIYDTSTDKSKSRG